MTGYRWNNFNPHFRKGSDEPAHVWQPLSTQFQSTLPQGKWLNRWRLRHPELSISIHTSAREVTWMDCSMATMSSIFQSTLPQGKWLFMLKTGTEIKQISIHTSAREVTVIGTLIVTSQKFQSTLPQGKWLLRGDGWVFERTFQSTLPQGKWPIYPGQRLKIVCISIHTSAREVTISTRWYSHRCKISIHTSAREVTMSQRMTVEQLEFQSTLPQGKWLSAGQYGWMGILISIHTSAREVTHCGHEQNIFYKISIHTSAREVTFANTIVLPHPVDFNPHFRKGSDCNIPQKHLSIFMKYL